MSMAIEINGLSVVFRARGNAVKALDGIDLQVRSGQVFGFLGPNGAGKTTLMHVLLGFIDATAGTARIFGTNVRESIARQRIGYLPEHPDTYRFMTGREVLKMTGRLFRMRGVRLKERIDEVLELTGVAFAADRRIAAYSRGMLQRIGLAQALINDPDLIILDEPTGGLDPIGRMAVREIIGGLRTKGKTVFFSSHELSEVEMVCDSLAILNRGRIVAYGATNELVRADKNLERFFMEVISKNENSRDNVGRLAGNAAS